MKKNYSLKFRRCHLLLICISAVVALQSVTATDYTLGTQYTLPQPWPQALFLWRTDAFSFRAGYFGSNYTVGPASAAFGYGNAFGGFSIASGYGSAGEGAAAFGSYTLASGFASFTAGSGTYAQAYYSAAWGVSTNAFGQGATASGIETAAGGVGSTAMGVSTYAGAYGSLAIGRWNVGAYTNNNNGNLNDDGDKEWFPQDPVFEIGIGTSTLRMNALTVYKNGNVTVSGVIRVTTPAGDIPMLPH